MWVIKVGQYYTGEDGHLVENQKDAYKMADKEEAGWLCDLTVNGRLVKVTRKDDSDDEV